MPNYTLTFVGGSLDISARAITVTADAKTKTYGDADPALTYQVTNLVGGDQLDRRARPLGRQRRRQVRHRPRDGGRR